MLQMVRRYKLFAAVAVVLFAGCERVDFKGFVMPTGDVVNERFEQSVAMHGGESVARLSSAESSYSVYVCTDPHIADSYGHLPEFAGALRGDESAPMGLMLGDCIDVRGAMPIYVEAIANDDAEQPIFSLLGNHDIYFSGWDAFKALVGPSVYWFELAHPAGKDLYVVLDSASGTLGGKQTEWLGALLAERRGDYRHCVISMHTNLFNTDGSQFATGNLGLEESMALWELFDKHDVTLCLQGHDHYREDLMLGGVRYVIVGALSQKMARPEYLRLIVTDQGVELDWRQVQ